MLRNVCRGDGTFDGFSPNTAWDNNVMIHDEDGTSNTPDIYNTDTICICFNNDGIVGDNDDDDDDDGDVSDDDCDDTSNGERADDVRRVAATCAPDE